MLNDCSWYWKNRNPNDWSPLAVQNRPADEDQGRPGAITTNGPGTALQRYAGPGSALPPQDAGVTNNTPPCVNKKSRDEEVNRRGRDNPPFPCIAGKGRQLFPGKLPHTKGVPGPPALLVLCGTPVPWVIEKSSSTPRKTLYHPH